MPSTESEALPEVRPQALFLTTRWSVVLTAKDKASPASAQALETLCRAYWFPLYAFIRGSGYAPHDAQDLTQAFFAKLRPRITCGWWSRRKAVFVLSCAWPQNGS